MISKNERNRLWYQEHREQRHEYDRLYYQTHREQERLKKRLWRARLKIEVFTHYSKGQPNCATCGEKNLELLTLAHKEAGSNLHRKSVNISSGTHTWYWARKHGYPDLFEVLCYSCHMQKDKIFIGHNPSQSRKMQQHPLRREELQKLLAEFPLPNGHPLLHFSVEEWLKKLRGLAW